MPVQRTVSPIDGRLVAERELADAAAVASALERAGAAFPRWRATPVAERCALLSRAVDALVARRDAIAREITLQIGRPIAHSPGELRGLEERARHMLELAPEALADVEPAPKPGFTRLIRREPLGLVLVLAPWNYPYLTAVNAIIPALAAGNTVLLKHSAQTPLVAERFQEAFDEAGLPAGVFQHLHLGHDAALELAASGAARLVCFTGSVGGGPAPPEGPPRPPSPPPAAPPASSASPVASAGAVPSRRPPATPSRPPTSSSAARTRPTSGTTPTSPTRSRTWSTVRASTPARAAAASSGSTSTSASTTPSSRATSTSPPATSLTTPSTPAPRSAPWSGPQPRTSPAARSPRPSARERAPSSTPPASSATAPARPTSPPSAWSTSTTACASCA